MWHGALLLLSALNAFAAAQEPEELPIGLTPWEAAHRHLIYENRDLTDPPPAPLRNIAEFERMSGVLIRYPLGISTEIVREMAEDVTVYCLVSSAQQSAANAAFAAASVDMSHVQFIVGPTDSYWTRDYGPWWVVDGNRAVSVVDFTYNRPRPNDDAAPYKVAQHLSVPYFATDLVHAGGNYMTDGYGISASTTLVYEENPIPASEVDATMESYWGVDTYHVVPDPNNDYIEHIDCWGKFLSPEKVLIREVPAAHLQYEEIESVAAYFAGQLNAFGEPYDVVRVFTPNDEPYTNSFFLNEKVMVPLVGSAWDDEMLAVYASALPGYEVLGFTGSWLSTDAIHCRVIGIPDLEMLQIFHNPIDDQPSPQEGYEVRCTIDDVSGAGLVPEQLHVYWKTAEMTDFQSLLLATSGNTDEYSSAIPAPHSNTEIRYFVHAADSSGRQETLPLAGYFSFQAAGLLEGDANFDGVINVLDVIVIVQHILGNNPLEGPGAQLADMNYDDTIDVFDIVRLVDVLIAP